MFDGYLKARHQRTGEPFVPFDAGADYDRYVDGKLRADGARAFLVSRGIHLPDGEPDDPPSKETVNGLANRKNELLQQHLRHGEVKVYDGSVKFARTAREEGLRIAVVSSSANTRTVLQVVGLGDLFDARIDGITAAERHLPGKPAPDMFLAGADAVGLEPGACAVFEDAEAGVQAGRAGGFRLVVGVDRVGHGHADALRTHGATEVVKDLSELLGEA
jgi:HAD superfamily hydrolase (TIGR01509 family)